MEIFSEQQMATKDIAGSCRIQLIKGWSYIFLLKHHLPSWSQYPQRVSPYPFIGPLHYLQSSSETQLLLVTIWILALVVIHSNMRSNIHFSEFIMQQYLNLNVVCRRNGHSYHVYNRLKYLHPKWAVKTNSSSYVTLIDMTNIEHYYGEKPQYVLKNKING
jgi:hypothetical protein